MKKVFSVVLIIVLLTMTMLVGFCVNAVEISHKGDIVYFDNSVTKYGEVYIYLWNQGGEMSWPGEKMSYLGNDIWAYTLTDDYNNLIFSQGNTSGQSEDLKFDGNNRIAVASSNSNYFSVTWSDYSGIRPPEKPSVNIPNDAIQYMGHYYKLYKNTVNTWEEAEEYCESLGGHLATISSAEEDRFAYDYLVKNSAETAYIGFTDSKQEGVWEWITGEPVVYTNWYPGEPNNSQGENYASYYYKFSNGQWNDGDFGHGTDNDKQYFLCEWDTLPNDSNLDLTTERIIIGTKTNYYGAANYESSKAGEVQDAAIEFKDKLVSYYNAFCSEGQKKLGNTNSLISLDDLAKQLRKQDESTSDKYITMIDSNVPSDCLDSVYYALADFLTNVVNNNVDLGSIDFSKDSITNAAKIVNAVKNGMRGSGKNTIRKGNYEITLNTQNMWGSFAGTVTAEKVSGFNSGSTYTGEIDSTMAGTKKVLATYMDCMSDIVKDACKYALFSILSEFKSVTGIAEFEKTQLENFFSDKIDILQKNGFGDVLGLFLNTRTGYKAVKPILNANTGSSLRTALNNAQRIYDSVNEMEFSTQGISKKAVKDAVKEVEKARKKLANKLFNYIYNTDEPLEEDGEFWDWIKNVFGIKCPVEFEVYDNNGNLIGYVDSSDKHEDYIWYTDDIYIEVDGNSKFVYAPVDMELNFNFTATDDGVMNYTIERQNGKERIERLNYFDVPLTAGETYEQNVPANAVLSNNSELPLVGDNEISYDQYLDATDLNGHIYIACEAENGVVIGDGAYPLGDLVKLVALENDEYKFKGWSLDGAIVETSEIYRFTAKENITVKAIYEKKNEADYSYTTEYADGYDECFVEVLKQADNKRDIHIAVPTNKIISVSSTRIDLYDNTNELISSETYSGETTSENDILISNLSLDNANRITITDSNNELVASLTKTDSLTPQQIIPDKDELTLKIKETSQINVFPVPAKSSLSDFSWESLNSEIAQVDENGIVTGMKPGKTTIRCYALNGEISCESEVNVYAEIGDSNLDGYVNINDVTAVQRHIAELEFLTDEQLAFSDTNGDGSIDISDATHLQKYLAEFNVALGKQS